MHSGEAAGSWLAGFQAPWQASINNTLAGSDSPGGTGWEPELHSWHWKGPDGAARAPAPAPGGQAGWADPGWAALPAAAKPAPESFPEQGVDGQSGKDKLLWIPRWQADTKGASAAAGAGQEGRRKH